MTVLLYCDLHSSKHALVWLSQLLKERHFDLILSPGDMVDRHDANAKQYVQELLGITSAHNVPIRMVFGNHESQEIISFYEYAGISLHNKSYEQAGYKFVGIGDIEVYPDRMVDPETLSIEGNILLTHRPPDRNSKLKNQISKLENAPAIHIAGHFHSNGFVEKMGKTLIVNIPAAIKGGAAILQLPQKSVQFIEDHV